MLAPCRASGWNTTAPQPGRWSSYPAPARIRQNPPVCQHDGVLKRPGASGAGCWRAHDDALRLRDRSTSDRRQDYGLGCLSMVKLVHRIVLAAAFVTGCQQAPLVASEEPESEPVACIDDGKDHYGVAAPVRRRPVRTDREPVAWTSDHVDDGVCSGNVADSGEGEAATEQEMRECFRSAPR